MATKKDLIDELNYLTDLLSQRSRTLATGVLAFCWLFILQNVTKNNDSQLFETSLLLVPVLLAILSLLMDAAQYWFGYLQTRKRLRELEGSNSNEVGFDHASLYFKLRTKSFYAKQLLVLIAVIWLLCMVVLSIEI